MLDELAAIARGERERAGLTQADIAGAAGVTVATISRFESRERTPRDLDQIIESYERELGLKAGELWRRAGEAP